MADTNSPTAANQFQQLRNRQNELYRKNTSEMVKAAKASNVPLVNKLRAERAKLTQNDKLIFDAELAFAASNLSQSDAEKRLVAQTQSANKMVKSIKTVAQVLASAAKMATILTRLITLVT